MKRILITGSTDGVGRATADALLDDLHHVVVHARTTARLAAVQDLIDRGAEAIVGDLSDLHEVHDLVEQANSLGPFDAVVHNAGVLHGAVLPVNVTAPYLMTAGIERPGRLIYLSSSMHRGGHPDLSGVDWTGSARRARTRTRSCSSPLSWPPSLGSGRTSSRTRSTPAGCPPGWADPARATTSPWRTSPRPGSRPPPTPRRSSVAATGATREPRSPTPPCTTRASRTSSCHRSPSRPASRYPPPDDADDAHDA